MCDNCKKYNVIKLALDRDQLHDLMEILKDSEKAATEAQEIEEVKAEPGAIESLKARRFTARNLTMILAYQLYANYRMEMEEEFSKEGNSQGSPQPQGPEEEPRPFTDQEWEWFNQMLKFKNN